MEAPDLSHMTSNDLCALMLECGTSRDATDQIFAKACRDELARRKPSTPEPKPARSGTEGGVA